MRVGKKKIDSENANQGGGGILHPSIFLALAIRDNVTKGQVAMQCKDIVGHLRRTYLQRTKNRYNYLSPKLSSNWVRIFPSRVIVCTAKPSSPPHGNQAVDGATCQVIPSRSKTRPLCQCPTSMSLIPSSRRAFISLDR